NYGIDTLIRAFALAVEEVEFGQNIKLEITGDGADLEKLQDLVSQLGIEMQVLFHGRVEHEKVPDMLNRLDIYVALSRAESFGVAILEASSCGLPVIVSDADGPAEVTAQNETGYIVPKDDPVAACHALIKLINDPERRVSMGEAG